MRARKKDPYSLVHGVGAESFFYGDGQGREAPLGKCDADLDQVNVESAGQIDFIRVGKAAPAAAVSSAPAKRELLSMVPAGLGSPGTGFHLVMPETEEVEKTGPKVAGASSGPR